MITYPLEFPAVSGPATMTHSIVSVVGVTTAPFSGEEQTQEHPGQWIEGILNFPWMLAADGAQWLAWLRKLRGPAGSFIMPEMIKKNAGSCFVTPGDPVVSGAGQTGNVLTIATGLGDVAKYFKADDQFSLGSGVTRRLHFVLNDADLVAGAATLEIWPRLRAVPDDGDSLDVQTPSGRYRLLDSKCDYDEDEVGNIQISSKAFREKM